MESSLRHLDRLASLGTLAAGSAHEVKNALVAIKTFAELSLERNGDDEMPALVLREIKCIDAIVSRILRMAGPARLVLKFVGLHAVVEDFLRLVQHRLGALNIQLHRSLLAAHDRLQVDEQQLGQAFINLLLNALESMHRKGSLAVTTEVVRAAKNAVQAKCVSSRPQIHLAFANTGCGISAENLPRLLHIFFTTKKEGTGLGLAITRLIIQENGGTITVESELKNGPPSTFICRCWTRARSGLSAVFGDVSAPPGSPVRKPALSHQAPAQCFGRSSSTFLLDPSTSTLWVSTPGSSLSAW